VAEAAQRKNIASVEEFAGAKVRALEGQLARLSISVVDATKSIEGLSIKRDDTVLGPGTFGVAIPIDPGVHEVVVTAQGYKQWKTSVSVAPGSNTYHVWVPTLEIIAPTPPPAAQAAEAIPPPKASPVAAPDSKEVRIVFSAPVDEGWTLHEASGQLVCSLPCTRSVGLGSGLYLERVGDGAKVRVPGGLPWLTTNDAVATPRPARGSPTWSTVSLIVSGLCFAVGLVNAVEGTCDDTAGNTYHGSACGNPSYTDETSTYVGVATFCGLATAASTFWWFWSRNEKLELATPSRLPANASGPSVGIGPSGIAITF
jgi:hypothetical protein